MSCQRAQRQVFVPHLAVVVGEHDTAGTDLSETGDIGEFAVCLLLAPATTTDTGRKKAPAIQPVFDMTSANKNAGVVVLTRGMETFGAGRSIHVVKRTRRMFGIDFRVHGIVKDLELAPQHTACKITHAVLHPAVGSGCDFPLELKIEVTELPGGDDITHPPAVVSQVNLAVDNFPAVLDWFAVHGLPARQVPAIKQGTTSLCGNSVWGRKDKDHPTRKQAPSQCHRIPRGLESQNGSSHQDIDAVHCTHGLALETDRKFDFRRQI